MPQFRQWRARTHHEFHSNIFRILSSEKKLIENPSIGSQMNQRVVTMISHGCATQKKSNANRTLCSIRSPRCPQPWQKVASTQIYRPKRIQWNRVNWLRDRAVWIDVVYWIAIDRSATAKVVVRIHCKSRHHRPIVETAEPMASPPISIMRINTIDQKGRKYSGNDHTSHIGIQIWATAAITMREVAKMFVSWNTMAAIIIGDITITIVATAMVCSTWPWKNSDRLSQMPMAAAVRASLIPEMVTCLAMITIAAAGFIRSQCRINRAVRASTWTHRRRHHHIGTNAVRFGMRLHILVYTASDMRVILE